MKKVLLATSALVVSAGIASAQGVAVSGYAEMGIVGGDGVGGDVEFHTDIDVTFTMSGETDNGLTFGASIDIDESDGSNTVCVDPAHGPGPGANDPASTCTTAGASGAFGSRTQGGETVFISGNFGTLTMGDTDGAFDWAMTEAIIGGSINDDHEHAGYNGNAGLDGTYDGQIARYDYSFGDFAFAASAEIDDRGVRGAILGIGGKYSGSFAGVSMGVGLGYTGRGSDDIIGVSLDANFDNGFRAIVNYSDHSNNNQNPFDSHMGVAAGYSMDAWTFAVNYGIFDAPGAGADSEGFGVIVNYDLGGGAEVQFGYGSSDVGGTTSDSFSLGVAMSF